MGSLATVDHKEVVTNELSGHHLREEDKTYSAAIRQPSISRILSSYPLSFLPFVSCLPFGVESPYLCREIDCRSHDSKSGFHTDSSP